MNALFQSFQAAFGTIFGAIWPQGLLHIQTRTDAADGDVSTVYTGDDGQPPATTISVQKDACTEAMRLQSGYTDRDVRLLILQIAPDTGMVLGEPNTDCQVTAEGTRWAISNIESDPVSGYWQMRGTPA